MPSAVRHASQDLTPRIGMGTSGLARHWASVRMEAARALLRVMIAVKHSAAKTPTRNAMRRHLDGLLARRLALLGHLTWRTATASIGLAKNWALELQVPPHGLRSSALLMAKIAGPVSAARHLASNVLRRAMIGHHASTIAPQVRTLRDLGSLSGVATSSVCGLLVLGHRSPQWYPSGCSMSAPGQEAIVRDRGVASE